MLDPNSIEREYKLNASSSFVMPDISLLVAGAKVGNPKTIKLVATHYDTADLRLSRWGITLRHRTGEAAPEWTLKFPTAGQEIPLGAPIVRRELTMAGDSGVVPRDILYLIHGYVRSASLGRVVTLHSTRRTVAVSGLDGSRLLEVDDDTVVAEREDATKTSFREIELEFEDAATDDQVGIVLGKLMAAGALHSQPIPKAIRALGGVSLAPPDLVARLSLSPTGSAADPSEMIAALAIGILRADLSVRLEGSVDAVGSMVSLLAALSYVLEHADRSFQPSARTRLQGAVGELSALFRHIDGLSDSVAGLEKLEQERLANNLAEFRTWTRLIENQCSEATAELRTIMGSEAYADLLETMVAGIAELPFG